jgi:hypothetical protein
MTYCHERIAVNTENRIKTAVSLPCKSWTCDHCVGQRQSRLIAECLGGAPTTFLTLTCRVRPGQSPDDWALLLSRAWRLMRLRIMRAKGIKKLPFYAVMESTKAGWPHLHILMRSIWLDQKWLSAMMDELLDSPKVDIRRIDNRGRAAGYVAKYCGKASHRFRTAKRYWSSRDYDLRPETKTFKKRSAESTWWLLSERLTKWCADKTAHGWQVEKIGATKAVARPPPEWLSDGAAYAET